MWLLAVTLAGCLGSETLQTPEEHYRRARRCESTGDFRAALSAWGSYLESQPEAVDGYLAYQELLEGQDGREAARQGLARLSPTNRQAALRFARLRNTTVGEVKGPLTLSVKYRDARGRWNGPYELAFDAARMAVEAARERLESPYPNWVDFFETSVGPVLSFGRLVSHKPIVSEVRYSIDSQAFDRRLRLSAVPRRDPADEEQIPWPEAARSVWVKVRLSDGSELARRFEREARPAPAPGPGRR
jgi:hypothetical protein